MKKSYLIYTLIGFFILIVVLTNPTQERHKEVVKSKINSYFQKYMVENNAEQEKNDLVNTGNAFGMAFGTVIINQIVENFVSTNNYLLFSTTNITWKNATKTIGVGCLEMFG